MRIKSLVLCGVAASAIAGAAQAQNAAPETDATAGNSQGIETVIVTARQRAESIQDAPIAVTAVDSEMLDKMFVKDLTDLNRAAPNFQIEGVGAIHRNAAVIFSRGIGYANVDQGQDPAVGISVDGVFYSRNIGALQDMWDIDNVQILRGPQGTLFGKNTVGGVVNITTKKPDFDHYELNAMARFGNLGRNDYGVVANLPIDDTLAVRLSAQSQYSYGAFTNLNTAMVDFPGPRPRSSRHVGGDNVKTVRGSVRWLPVPNLELNLSGTYIKDRSSSVGGQNGSPPTDLISFAFGQPGFGYPGGPTNPYSIMRDFPSGDYQDTAIVVLNGRYHADGFDIVSVTGFIRDSNLSYNDYDNTSLAFLDTSYGLHHKQFSQELRVESTGDSKLQWVGGLYFFTNSWDAAQHFYLPILSPLAPFQDDLASQTAHDYAAFVQADYQLTEKFQATFGVRYTQESKNIFRILQYADGTPTPPPILDPATGKIPKHTWSDATYHLGANYRINENTLSYFSFSTGFVGGGFNSRSNLASTIGPFQPEKAKSYEVGLKSDWLDHQLRINLAAFWANYSDLQVGVFHRVNSVDGEQQIVANDAFERARGLELEVTAAPYKSLLLTTSIGYLDARYTSFFSDLTGTGIPTDNTYLTPAYSPKWTMRVEASYDFELGDYGKLTPDVSFNFESSHYTDINNSDVGRQGSFGLLNSSLTYADPNDRWQISLWGKNLLDRRYRLSAVPTAGLFTQLYFADPRTIGVELRIHMSYDAQ